MRILGITITIIILGILLYVSDNILFDAKQGLISSHRKAYAESNLTANSSLSIDEEYEENLGKIIGACYLDPLCFKLEIPENRSR